jgi:hypothetical protein
MVSTQGHPKRKQDLRIQNQYVFAFKTLPSAEVQYFYQTGLYCIYVFIDVLL